jgi:membrane-associated protease RseP (regulator of RpoE activity)
VQWKVALHTSVRSSVDYVMTRHNIFGGPAFTQNNVRVSVGIVYTFGRMRGASAEASAQEASAPLQTGPTSEAPLLGVSGRATEVGFRITSVRAGSPAAQLFLNPGDIVTRIDDREVRSSVEIESAIAASASGTIKVTCLIQTTAVGMVVSERQVKVR